MATVIPQAAIICVKQCHNAVTLVKSQQHRIMQPLLSHMAYLELVYHKFNEMHLVPVELQPLGYLPDLAVYAGMEEPFPPELLEELLVMTLPSLDQWGKNENPVLVKPL